MGIVSWVVLGAIAGFLAKLVIGATNGLLNAVVLGIVGAVVGGFIGSAIFNRGDVTGDTIESAVISVLGAILVLIECWAWTQPSPSLRLDGRSETTDPLAPGATKNRA